MICIWWHRQHPHSYPIYTMCIRSDLSMVALYPHYMMCMTVYHWKQRIYQIDMVSMRIHLVHHYIYPWYMDHMMMHRVLLNRCEHHNPGIRWPGCYWNIDQHHMMHMIEMIENQ
jgi:hypothetical protein